MCCFVVNGDLSRAILSIVLVISVDSRMRQLYFIWELRSGVRTWNTLQCAVVIWPTIDSWLFRLDLFTYISEHGLRKMLGPISKLVTVVVVMIYGVWQYLVSVFSDVIAVECFSYIGFVEFRSGLFAFSCEVPNPYYQPKELLYIYH